MDAMAADFRRAASPWDAVTLLLREDDIVKLLSRSDVDLEELRLAVSIKQTRTRGSRILSSRLIHWSVVESLGVAGARARLRDLEGKTVGPVDVLLALRKIEAVETCFAERGVPLEHLRDYGGPNNWGLVG